MRATRIMPAPPLARDRHVQHVGPVIPDLDGQRPPADRGCLCAQPEYWSRDATGICRVDRLWFDDSVGGGGRAQAMAICFRCPLRQACYDYAEDTRQRDGVWGGVDMGQAARLRYEADRRKSYLRKVAANG